MVRHLIKEDVAELMQMREGLMSKTSWDALNRRYARIIRELIALNESKQISTLSPAKMTPEDIKAFVVYRKGKNVSVSDINHDLSALKQLLLSKGNGAVNVAIHKYPGLKNAVVHQRLDPLPEVAYDAILGKYEEADKTDFHQIRKLALVLMYIGTGCRNKELRLAELDDLDTLKWLLTVRHPKGEGTYGVVRKVIVPEAIRPAVKDYLTLRSAWLISHRVKSSSLFFALDGVYGPLSGNSIRTLKDGVAEMIGMKFELRDCRRAFGQRYIDNGADYGAVSKLMGHATPVTTSRYYAGLSNSMAIEQMEGLWEKKKCKVNAGEDQE